MQPKESNFAHILRNRGFKATAGRVRLLALLAEESSPLPIADIKKKLHSKLNEVTLYRALEALAASGIVRRVDFKHRHAHYEFANTHHHHLVCTSCETIEDVKPREEGALERRVLRQSEKFASIDSHALEFFGLCNNCTKI